MNAFPKYPKYKDSGEYWMGEIPEFWELRKMKHLFREKKITHNADLECGSISFGEVVSKGDEKVTEATKASYQEVLSGEFLINPLNLNYDLRSLRIGLSRINVVVSSGYIVMQNRCILNKEYYRWLLHRYDVAFMKLLGSGVRQTISFNHIANSLLAFPPPAEQTAIADFLDDKTAKIDKAIAQKERLIALLKERKQIIIQNAVTKGLDPKVKMKDSGIEWIGEIPEHWEVRLLKREVDFLPGYAFASAGFVAESPDSIKLLRGINVKAEGIDWSETVWWANTRTKGLDRYALRAGDLVIGMDRPWVKGGIRVQEVQAVDTPSMVLQRVCRMRALDELEQRFLLHLLKLPSFLAYFEPILTGVSVPHISETQIGNFPIGLPPVSEQRAILEVVSAQSEKTELALERATQSIQNLREYRATLIDSAVTGKIKVPGI